MDKAQRAGMVWRMAEAAGTRSGRDMWTLDPITQQRILGGYDRALDELIAMGWTPPEGVVADQHAAIPILKFFARFDAFLPETFDPVAKMAARRLWIEQRDKSGDPYWVLTLSGQRLLEESERAK